MTLTELRTRFESMAVMITPPPVPVVEGAEPAPPPAPVPAVALTDHLQRGTDLDVTIPVSQVVSAANLLFDTQYCLEAITGVDWMAEKQFEVVYDYTSFANGARITVRTRVPRDQPELPTISTVFPSANWHERETHDFFGLVFTGHPELIPLLLPEDATFHPLRKDYGA
jgi:NADH-quinone oxidoreductase subunit C